MNRNIGGTNSAFPPAFSRVSAREIALAHPPARYNRGRWHINCPAHGGDGQKLGIWDGEDGIGAKCISEGCDYGDIMRALGVPRTPRPRRTYEARRMAIYHHVDGTPRESWRVDYPEDFNTTGPCPYGKTTGKQCKKGTKPHKHSFSKPSGLTRRGVLPLLWTLDHPDNFLVIPEGEPAASQLAYYAISGITPISYFGGGGAVLDTYWGDTLTGRIVVIWPDPDTTGQKALADMIAIAYQSGAEQVLVVEVGDLAGVDGEKDKDAADLDAEECESRIRGARAPQPGSVPENTSTLTEDPQPEPISHRMLARSFAEEWAKIYNYDEDAKVWRRWDGIAWQKVGLEIIRDIGEHIDNVMKRERQSRHYLLSHTSHKGVKSLAEAYLAVDFDLDPDLLALPNGEVLNIRTGQQHELKREHRITRSLPESILHPSKPPEGGKLTEWEDFVLESLSHYDPDARDKIATFLQEWAGSALSGDCRDEVMIFLWGRPGTGKSTFTETLLAMFGTYGKTVAGKRVVGRGDGHLQWLANLEGIRLIVFDEMPENGRWQADLLNPLISGQMIEANRMRENSMTFKSQAHVIATGNHRPKARAASGLWRRMVIVEFQHIPVNEDTQLKERLAASLGDVYRWAHEGLNSWIANGRHLQVPEVLKQGSQDYRAAADPVAQFVQDRLETKDREYVTVAALYAVFADWWEQNVSDKIPAKQTLTMALDDLGYEPTTRIRVDGTVTRVRYGLGIRD